jgi:Domain of unknown function (DUF4328)
MTDIWVCGNCHSINRQRGNRCYKCGASQETAATGAMSTLRQEEAIINRTVVKYKPAAALGLAASIFLLGLVGVAVASFVQSLELSRFLDAQLTTLEATGKIDEAAFIAQDREINQLFLINIAVVVPALLFFGAWLGRVIGNVPALGGGVPGTSPGRAFIKTLTPVANLWLVPGMIQDVLYRLDPKGGGLFMVGIAWVGLVGSWIVSFIAGWYFDLRLTFDILNAESIKEAVAAFRALLGPIFILDIVTLAMMAIGVLVLIMLMVRIERRSRARDAEVRAVAEAKLGAAN